MRRHLLRLVTLVFGLVSIFNPLNVSAMNGKYDYGFFSANNIEVYNPNDSGCTSASGVATGGPNKDYLGNDILTTAQLAAIQQNQPIYQQAATQVGIPWQMLAVIHLRESGLRKENPANGQGIYQDSTKSNGPYPTGPVTDAEFLRQTIWAANFLKNKSPDPSLLASGDPATIKDTFYGYNGRASVYATQAQSLGYTNAYEGSPYVMNRADAKRDPATNPTGWGQIKTDGGPLVYPANSGYGAYVIYASLAGIATSGCTTTAGTGSCTSSTDLRTNLVACAQQELALWQAGKMSPGFRTNDPTSYTKYTYNTHADWCAFFISWILKQSGKPLPTKNNVWSFVSQFTSNASSVGFTVHSRGDGYKPQPGDLAIYGNHDHINMVTGYSGNYMLTIGGNQHNSGMDTNIVSQNIGYGNTANWYIQVN